ncbi:hypothetical protein [Rhodococcus sp. T2V]|uniref:hypothetical protein n=1 Tax=Rhodococcus sp. T2V TaxID=3034164 RepID=UPI0023E31B03|nr:hypothetical protein [Rhodococcus sp. T2V]
MINPPSAVTVGARQSGDILPLPAGNDPGAEAGTPSACSKSLADEEVPTDKGSHPARDISFRVRARGRRPERLDDVALLQRSTMPTIFERV